MLTKWAKLLVGTKSQNSPSFIPSVTISQGGYANIEAKTIQGNTKYINAYGVAPISLIITSQLVENGSSASAGVAFGSSDTEPTENDFTLGSIILGLSASTSTPSVETIFDSVNNKYIARYTYTLNNNTGSDVTIKEVGLYGKLSTANTQNGSASTSNSSKYSFLIDRTILDTPVTIVSGGVGVVRYDFVY